MKTSKEHKSSKDTITDNYNSLMNGFNDSPLFHLTPLLSNGKYVQLSAYEKNGISQAVTANTKMNLLIKQ